MSNLSALGLPKDYVNPNKIGLYLKLDASNKQGVRLRLLGVFDQPQLAVRGYEGWEYIFDEQTQQQVKRPHRVPIENRNELSRAGYEEVKHFYAFAVYNFQMGAIQCWQINQSTIQDRLEELAEIHGVPTAYDLQVLRKGTGKNDTKYSIEKVEPTTESTSVAFRALEESTIDLRQLFAGGDIMTPLEEKAADGNSERFDKATAKMDTVQLVRGRFESAKTYEELNEAIMLRESYAGRGEITKSELAQMKLLEAKIKDRLANAAEVA